MDIIDIGETPNDNSAPEVGVPSLSDLKELKRESIVSGELAMMKRLMMVGLIASTFGVVGGRPGYAQITSVTVDAPGNLVPYLQIDSLVNYDDAVAFKAYYLTPAAVDFDVTVAGPGIYYVGYGYIENDTTATFPSFYGYLDSAPAGSVIGLASYSPSTFGNGVSGSPPDAPTSITFNGPPGLGVGDGTSLYVGIYIPPADTGTQTFELALTPTAASVPEPSSLVLGLIAGLAMGFGYGTHRIKSVRNRSRA